MMTQDDPSRQVVEILWVTALYSSILSDIVDGDHPVSSS
jgi:hypothetical protein